MARRRHQRAAVHGGRTPSATARRGALRACSRCRTRLASRRRCGRSRGRHRADARHRRSPAAPPDAAWPGGCSSVRWSHACMRLMYYGMTASPDVERTWRISARYRPVRSALDRRVTHRRPEPARSSRARRIRSRAATPSWHAPCVGRTTPRGTARDERTSATGTASRWLVTLVRARCATRARLADELVRVAVGWTRHRTCGRA